MPDDGLWHFRIDQFCQTGKTPDLPVISGRERLKFLQDTVYSCRVGHIGSQQRAAAVELKIKVASVNYGLHKKLHTAVFPDLALKQGMNRAHILIFHTKDAINICVIIQQFTKSPGVVRASFRSAAIHNKWQDPAPDGPVPSPLRFGELPGEEYFVGWLDHDIYHLRQCLFFVNSTFMNPDMLYLQQSARHLGVELDEKQLALFDVYQKELLKWNEKTNLISEKTTGDIVNRHFLDSLTAAGFITTPNARIVDIGSGAGFPGIPLKIFLPSIQLHLLESNRKKVSFLKQVTRLLKLENTFIIHDRTENITRTDAWREKFEIVISRAAFKLSDLLPLGQYFLVPEGLLITLKGPDVSVELKAALKGEITSKIYQINQYDINKSFLGPPRKIIIARKTK